MANYTATLTNAAGTTKDTTNATISAAELGTEFDAISTSVATKADLASPTFTGTVVLPATTSISTVSATEIAYLDGVTSAIQTQLNAKMTTASHPTITSLEGLSLVAGDIVYATAADTLQRLAKGTAAQHLVMNAGATAPEWSTSASGVTSVTGTAPVVSSGGATPAISIPAATASVAGHMTAAYASKLDGIAAGATVGVPKDAGAIGIGVILPLTNTTGVAIASGATSATGLKTRLNNVVTGTWRNIEEDSCADLATCTFQRIS